jgi:hypothetical protein
VYIAHTDFQGSVGVIFSTVASPGFTGVWVSETSQFLNIGTTPTGINVGYGACLSGPVIIATAEYQMFGTSSCSQLSIAPFPDFPNPVCLECFYEYPCVNNGRLLVNCAVPVEPTTWGKVKALYRN